MRLADGRRAQLWLGGAEEGPLVLFFHGCPDTRHVATTGHEAAVAAGVRMLCVNRPGYGASDRHDATQSTVADDAVAVAESLGHHRFAVLGMSVGCSYAIAVAARHPSRVDAVGLVAAQAPAPEPGSVSDKIKRFRPGFVDYVARLAVADPDDAAVAGRFLEQLPRADAAALAAGFNTAGTAAAAREALATPEGYLRDAALLLSPWDHTPAEVTAPVRLWFGELDDRVASPAWVRLFADPVCVILPGTTHLATLLTHWTDILRCLRHDMGN